MFRDLHNRYDRPIGDMGVGSEGGEAADAAGLAARRGVVVLKDLVLSNFKAFEGFRLSLRPGLNLLVGPNNAGKSTLISALRASAAMMQIARRPQGNTRREDGGYYYRVQYFTNTQVGLEDPNLRYNFQSVDTRLKLSLPDRAQLRACWPAATDDDPYFYFVYADSAELQPPIRSISCPAVGVVPVITPLEHREQTLTRDYVMRNLATRLASRHFRNQLLLLSRDAGTENATAFQDFLGFIEPWLPEMELDVPEVREGEKSFEVDLFYREGRFTREVAWAGDGMQVYLQLLLHIFRARSADVIILDEPDVYLHADVQRRLLRLLNALAAQVIVSTHSTEMVAEAPPESVVWIDRSRRASVRSPDPATLTELAATIGSLFNLRLARVLRARVALFVEGKDMTVLRVLAGKVGADSIVAETEVAVVPLEGSANWQRLDGFKWLYEKLLKGAVSGFVLLDRDFHTAPAVAKLDQDLKGMKLDSHVWNRHELESYVLVPSALARVTEMAMDEMQRLLSDVTEELRSKVIAGLADSGYMERLDPKHMPAKIIADCEHRVAANWQDLDWRLSVCPAKEVLAGLNRRLQMAKKPTVSAYKVAVAMRREEVPTEMASILRRIDRLATSKG
jgi:energy-coupling factor transporter ATP-binding protein EcfA2